MFKMENKKVVIMGFGVTGQAAIKYLTNKSAVVSVYDSRKESDFDSNLLNKFSDAEFNFETNDFNPEEFDLIVTSPGVSVEKSEILKSARDLGIPIHNDTTLFIEEWRKIGPIVGVTGSNGKSTVVSLLYESIKDQCSVVLGGNIGASPLDFLYSKPEPGTIAILELSSYQLELFKSEHYLDICLITNISSNHLDRYGGSIEKYSDAKMLGIDNSNTQFITTTDDDGVKKYILPKLKVKNFYDVSFEQLVDEAVEDGIYTNEKGELILKTGDKIDLVFDNVEKRNLIGLHNLYNIGFVLGIINLLNLSTSKSIQKIREFRGLEHRIEKVRELNGVTYVNDSKSTSPAATNVALESLGKNNNVVLIIGGTDKGIDFSSLENSFLNKVKEIVLLPGGIEDKILKIKDELDIKTTEIEKMSEAVEYANQVAVSGDVVLLSPASGSFHQYTSFEKRGEDFKEIVNKI